MLESVVNFRISARVNRYKDEIGCEFNLKPLADA